MAIRLRHVNRTDQMFTVMHHRPLRQPMFCAVCGAVHTYKTYHLTLDSQGECVVSETIAERLLELPGLPFRKVGKETNPQPQTISAPVGGQQDFVRQPVHLFVPTSLREAHERSMDVELREEL